MSDQTQTQSQSQDPAGNVSESTEQSLSDEIKTQADNIERGVTDMPIDAARNSIGRWKRNLDNVQNVDGIDAVKRGLDDLLGQLDADGPDGHKIGQVLADLAGSTLTVADAAPGRVGSALNALAAALDQGAKHLHGDA